MKLSDFQRRLLSFRTHAHIASLGGRGGGKTTALLHDALTTMHEQREMFRGLIVRESHGGLLEISDRAYGMAVQMWGAGSVTRNKGEGSLTVNSIGAKLTFSQISDEASYSRHLGSGLGWLGLDETGNYLPTTWKIAQRLRSNMRLPAPFVPRIHITGNPGGRSSHYIRRTFVNKSPWWQPYRESDDQSDWWINAHSTLFDNPGVNHDTYVRNLRHATSGDEYMSQSWIEGIFAEGSDLIFPAFDADVNIAEPAYLDNPKFLVGGDYGISAPSVILLGAITRDFMANPPSRPGSVFIIDEFHTCNSDEDLNSGNGMVPLELAEATVEMCHKHGCHKPEVVIDDYRGFATSVIEFFNKTECWASKPSHKSRTGGFARINQMLRNAKTGDGPGLYISPRCRYLLSTLPEAPRGNLNPEDMPSDYPDHG
ncbi:MAG TPA: hypothetical protein P5114_09010, partial [Hyphomicrobiaceae bacterium]|nr:hypothetical protein [Hyphomicrobiaceae bacterium]